MILKIIGFLLVFHTLIFADSVDSSKSKEVDFQTALVEEKVEISFGTESVFYMFILTSLLGSFFLRDELADSL